MPISIPSKRPSRRASRAKRQLFRSVEGLELRTLMTASLVRDINLTATQPDNITDVNGTAFYTSGNSRIGLYTETLNEPLHTFAATSVLGNFTPVESELFFTVQDSTGRTLWRSDGTTAGTLELKNITPGLFDVQTIDMLAVDSMLYFSAADGSGGAKLWKSDGTIAGTVLVADPSPGAVRQTSYNLTAVGSTIYFTVVHGYSEAGALFRSDGTTAGTSRVIAADPRAGFGAAGDLMVVGSTLYFTANSYVDNKAAGDSLWKVDGTAAGAVPVTSLQGALMSQTATATTNDVYAVIKDSGSWVLWRTDGSDVGTGPLLELLGSPYEVRVSHVMAAGTELFFEYDDGIHGMELWHSDGTPAGTRIVADLNPGPGGSDLHNRTAVGNSLYFTMTDASNVVHLYKTDGTTGGTNALAVLHDLDLRYQVPASGDSLVRIAFDGALYYVDNDPTYGPELFRTDGTTTEIVKDLVPGPEGIHPRDLSVVGDHLYFAGNDDILTTSLYRTNGTEAGTVAAETFTDFATADSTSGSNALGRIGDVEIFLADDGIHGAELWRTDGTAAGTSLIANINPNGEIEPTAAVLLDGYLYFGLDDAGTHGLSGLWRTDGTPAGTNLVRPFDGRSPEELAVFGGHVYFSADDGSSGIELWRSDGTATGTTLVRDIGPGKESSYPSEMTAVGSNLFFKTHGGGSEYDNDLMRSLWKTDGTLDGTVEVRPPDLPTTNNLAPNELTAVGGLLYFFGYVPYDDSVSEHQLWKSDGTNEGTVLVKRLGGATGLPSESSSARMIAVGSHVFFSINEDSRKSQVWTSDGTEAGTFLLKQICTLTRTTNLSSNPFIIRDLTALDANTLLFTAIDDAHGHELWRSDGTVAGTVLVTDLNPGPADGFNAAPTGLRRLQSIDGSVYFVADNGTDGNGLYRTDGTALGTVRFQNDVAYRNIGTEVLTILPSGILVTANGGYGTGLEPFLLDGTLANMPPIINPLAEQTTRVNQSLMIPLTVNDPNIGQTLTYSVRDDTANPNFTASINVATGTIIFQASHAGTYQFQVDVSDDGSPLPLTTTTTVTVHVRGNVADDFDGDGTSDYAVYRPESGDWIVRQSIGGTVITQFGDPVAGDLAAPGDFDGDGITDFAVYRPSAGLWIVRQSTGGTLVTQMGDPSAGDISAPGDFDGDGITDFVVYRPSAGLWIVRQSTGDTVITQMGDPSAGDVPANTSPGFQLWRPSPLWARQKRQEATLF